MRPLGRERRTVWASLYEEDVELADSDGNYTGEHSARRSKPVELHPTLSPASGALESYGFGTGGDYERVMVLYGSGTGIDESTVLWVDIEPLLDADGNLAYKDGNPVTPWDYVVARPVAESRNVTKVAIRRADR